MNHFGLSGRGRGGGAGAGGGRESGALVIRDKTLDAQGEPKERRGEKRETIAAVSVAHVILVKDFLLNRFKLVNNFVLLVSVLSFHRREDILENLLLLLRRWVLREPIAWRCTPHHIRLAWLSTATRWCTTTARCSVARLLLPELMVCLHRGGGEMWGEGRGLEGEGERKKEERKCIQQWFR